MSKPNPASFVHRAAGADLLALGAQPVVQVVVRALRVVSGKQLEVHDSHPDFMVWSRVRHPPETPEMEAWGIRLVACQYS